MREFAYLCLDCDKVFYVARYREGETLCPRCAGRAHVPLSAMVPPVAGGAALPEPCPEEAEAEALVRSLIEFGFREVRP